MEKNYQNIEIPDFFQLTKDVTAQVQELDQLNRYKFGDLFIQRHNYFDRNSKTWAKDIVYNTKLKDSDKKLNEVQGVYVFFEDCSPVYAGISRKLQKRLRHHFLGKKHTEASLAYLMARHEYDITHQEIFMKERKDFPFSKYRIDIQKEMQDKWEVVIIPMVDYYKMYFLEYAIAVHWKCKWNAFVNF